MGFLDIVMEAGKKKSKAVNIKAPETKSTDYTEDVNTKDDEDSTDTGSEDTGTDTGDDTPPDNEATDYTADTPDDGDNVESDSEEPADGGDDTPPDNEATDYTADTPDDGGDGTEDGATDDTGGDAGGDTPSDEDVNSAEDSTEVTEEDARNKRLLQEDYIDLYFRTKDFINKLSSLDKTNVILNQITVQIDKNLNRLKTALWDYVVYEYDRTSYITNLYKYNQLIEAFKVNLGILSAAREHIVKLDESETKKAKNNKSR